MQLFTFSALLALATNAAAYVPAGTPEFRNEFLAVHNQYRQEHGSPPLTWDFGLEQSAQAWANQCNYKHSPNTGPGARICGESLSCGAPHQTPRSVVEGWISERDIYNFDTHVIDNETGNFAGAVWEATQKLGCGAMPACANIPAMVDNDWHQPVPLYVCHYWPPGSKDSAQAAMNVHRKGYRRPGIYGRDLNSTTEAEIEFAPVSSLVYVHRDNLLKREATVEQEPEIA
ncbi:CAP domain-containing protein, partial [Pyronema domesticum]